MCVYTCVYVCVCVRARARVCARVRACACVCVCVSARECVRHARVRVRPQKPSFLRASTETIRLIDLIMIIDCFYTAIPSALEQTGLRFLSHGTLHDD